MTDDGSLRRAVERDDTSRAGGELTGGHRRAVYLLGIAFTLFQLWTAAFNPLSSLVVRSVHVGFLLAMTFLLFGVRRTGSRPRVPWWDYGLAAAGFGLGLYHLVFEHDLIVRAGEPTTADLAVGTLNILLVAEAARRVMGWGLPALCLAFVPYALLGPDLPGLLAHRGYGLDQVVDQLQFSTEGIYGTPTFVSATFIFLFILFGMVLERAGAIRLFNNLSLRLVGRTQGGAAKVAVLSSGLMGTVSGSGIANVMTTGQFTIPLMKRFGYTPVFAGALEATASMGGQIMPPVMGAAAFIMAETLAIPYSEVALAAALPALLYFLTPFVVSHLEAGRLSLRGLPASEIPSARQALATGWYLLLPLGALVWLLFSGFTPLFAGFIGIAGTAALVLGRQLAPGRGMAPRILFWLALGSLAAGLSRLGLRLETVSVGLVLVLAAACLVMPDGRRTVGLLVDSMADAARGAVSVGVACALVGILIGVLSLTGLASALAGLIVDLSGGHLLPALLLTMMACLVLGTGLPTTANYIITASIAAPALLDMGVPPLVSHMFCFYFGIMADLTPPVALAALAASPIAGAGHLPIGWLATRIAAAGYLVPFMAVYDPALMLQGGDLADSAYMLAKAALGVVMWSAAVVGYLAVPLARWERVVALVSAALLVAAAAWTDLAGVLLSVGFLAVKWWQASARTGGARG